MSGEHFRKAAYLLVASMARERLESHVRVASGALNAIDPGVIRAAFEIVRQLEAAGAIPPPVDTQKVPS